MTQIRITSMITQLALLNRTGETDTVTPVATVCLRDDGAWKPASIPSTAFVAARINSPTPLAPVVADKADCASKGAKANWDVRSPETAISLSEVMTRFHDDFPDAHSHAVEGDLLTRGLVVYNPENSTQFVTVPSQQLLLSAFVYSASGELIDAKFNGSPQMRDIETPSIALPTTENRAVIASLYDAIMVPGAQLEHMPQTMTRGMFGVGYEREVWAINKKTFELMRIPHDELQEGCVEIDEGVHTNPLSATLGMALAMRREREKLRREYGDFMLVCTSTLPCGTPENTRINSRHPALGKYIFGISKRWFPHFTPRSGVEREVMEQLAVHHGYTNFTDMKSRHGDVRTWAFAAGHLNPGVITVQDPVTGRHNMPVDLMLNLNRLMCSELGAAIRMFTASGPYYFGIAPRVRGRFPRDTRELIRNIMGTALTGNEPIRDEKHLLDILRHTMTKGADGADRLDRAAVAHTVRHADGSVQYIPTAHGTARLRMTAVKKGGEYLPMGRVEFVAAGASSILPRVRGEMILHLMQGMALAATHHGMNSVDYAAQLIKHRGFTSADVWGNADATVREYLFDGPDTPRVRQHRQMWRSLIENMNIPALENIGRMTLKSFDLFADEGDLDAFAHGRGTLGAAGMRMAEAGVSSEKFAMRVAELQLREENFLIHANRRSREAYLMGEVGV